MDAIQKEIEATAVAEKKAAEEAAAAEAEGGDEGGADLDLGGSTEEADIDEGGDEDMDLTPMPMESFTGNGGDATLLEDGIGNDFIVLEESDDLPTPDQLNDSLDFSENN
jgi:hypothetical protein